MELHSAGRGSTTCMRTWARLQREVGAIVALRGKHAHQVEPRGPRLAVAPRHKVVGAPRVGAPRLGACPHQVVVPDGK